MCVRWPRCGTVGTAGGDCGKQGSSCPVQREQVPPGWLCRVLLGGGRGYVASARVWKLLIVQQQQQKRTDRVNEAKLLGLASVLSFRGFCGVLLWEATPSAFPLFSSRSGRVNSGVEEVAFLSGGGFKNI